MLNKVGDLGYASELGNYVEYSGAPNEDEVLQYARVVLDVRTYRTLYRVKNKLKKKKKATLNKGNMTNK